MKFMRVIFTISIFLGFASSFSAQVFYHYRETTGVKNETRILEVQKISTGYIIKTGFSVFETDASRGVLRWTMVNQAEGISINAVLNGTKIILEGTFKNKAVSKQYDTKGKPWYMLQYFSLSELARSGQKRAEFYAINPLSLEGSILEAVCGETDDVMVDGKLNTTKKIRVSLTGVLAPFWSASLWFNLDSVPICLRFEMNKGPGTPMTVSELVKILP